MRVFLTARRRKTANMADRELMELAVAVATKYDPHRSRGWVSARDFASEEQLPERLMAFIGELNEVDHPFNWTSQSVVKVMAKCQIEDRQPVATAA